jgi:hypothetical protein
VATTNRSARRTSAWKPTRRTLTEWLPYWQNELGARDVSARTVGNQRKAIAKLTRGVGDVAPETLTAEPLCAWRDDMRSKLMDSSVNCYLLTVGT